MIQTPTLQIAVHLFNLSNDTTTTSNAWIFVTTYIYYITYNHKLSTITINSQHLLLSVELDQKNIWLMDKLHYILDHCTMNRQATSTIWSIFDIFLQCMS
jgi:hypothetical protein